MILRQIPDPRQRRLVADRLAQNRPFGARRPHDGHHDLHQRALAGAVGPEQAENLASPDVHLDPAQRMDPPAIDLLHAGEVDGQVGTAHSGVL